MSAEYIAFINDQEYGPVGYDDLKDMWARGEITNETQVRFSNNTAWTSWQAILNAQAEAQAIRARATMSARPAVGGYIVKDYLPGMPGVRDKLRDGTAYRGLRGCLIAIIVIGLLGAVASVIALFNDDARPLGITGLIACLSSIFSSFVTMVILDIADASLRKIE